ncbi:MAG: mannose-1-phosphate guanylyltransferase [Deltaproteobacteria bacterium]|nr:mannose-1-phosphate guanylyltransferase [Deltaproteobacteria bacterium]
MIWAVLMAGGLGSRLWPLSRRGLPKQLLPLDGDQTLLQEAVDGLAGLVPPARILVVTGPHLAEEVRRQLPDLPDENVLIEPTARSTLPCALWGSAVAWGRGAELVVVLPTDQRVSPRGAWVEALELAAGAARGGALALVGVRPDRPETGFGWISAGEPLVGGGRAVRGFVEKPPLPQAEALLAEGALWNGGIFAWRPADLAARVEARFPGGGAAMEALAAGVQVREVWEQLPATSVDRGLLEGAEGLAVVEGQFSWRDLGSWGALGEVLPEVSEGRALAEETVSIDAQGLVIHAPGRLVATLGVRDLVVVDTGDALLVCAKDQLTRLPELLEQLGPRWR